MLVFSVAPNFFLEKQVEVAIQLLYQVLPFGFIQDSFLFYLTQQFLTVFRLHWVAFRVCHPVAWKQALFLSISCNNIEANFFVVRHDQIVKNLRNSGRDVREWIVQVDKCLSWGEVKLHMRRSLFSIGTRNNTSRKQAFRWSRAILSSILPVIILRRWGGGGRWIYGPDGSCGQGGAVTAWGLQPRWVVMAKVRGFGWRGRLAKVGGCSLIGKEGGGSV